MKLGASRRSVLGAVAGSAVAAAGGCSTDAAPQPVGSPTSPIRVHQVGVVTPPPAAVVVAAFDLAVTGRDDLLSLITALSDRIGRVGAGVTVTVGVGASLFDDRFGLAAVRPSLLTAMPAFSGDVLDPDSCHGDLLVQVCAEDEERAVVVLDDVVTAMGKRRVRARWRMNGFRSDNQVTSGRPTMRNPFGFREGMGNPDPSDTVLMDQLIWVDADEPGWAAGGTYAVVRLIRLATTLWNREAIPRQEQVIGRTRTDDIALGQNRSDAVFDFAGDPDGLQVALDAHIRRANPRTAEAEQHRMLRRGYAFHHSGLVAGEPEDGLLFICFQRDPELAFAATQRRLAGEALERYTLPFGGGYFFIPPSVTALSELLAG